MFEVFDGAKTPGLDGGNNITGFLSFKNDISVYFSLYIHTVYPHYLLYTCMMEH